MRILTFFLFILSPFAAIGQDKSIQLTYKDSQDPLIFESISNSTKLSKYTSLDGSELSIGDTLILGNPVGNTGETRVSLGKLKTKTASSFTTIKLGRPAGFGNIMSAMNGDDASTAGPDMIGQVVKIVEMVAYHKGSKKKPIAVSIILGEPNGRAFGINKYLSLMDYENSALLGEIKSKNAPMSSDEALAELKKAKDKLDLELITLEEYNKMKEKLKKFIN